MLALRNLQIILFLFSRKVRSNISFFGPLNLRKGEARRSEKTPDADASNLPQCGLERISEFNALQRTNKSSCVLCAFVGKK